jgi:hypothetical protein
MRIVIALLLAAGALATAGCDDKKPGTKPTDPAAAAADDLHGPASTATAKSTAAPGHTGAPRGTAKPGG